jgi:hypothetical protein
MTYRQIDSYSGIVKENDLNFNATKYLSTFKYLKIILLIDDSHCQINYWHDTVKTIKTLFNIYTIYNSIDVCFINNLDRCNVKHPQELDSFLNITPSGNKPIKLKLQQIMAQNSHFYKPVLILIATHDEPTDYHGNNQTEEFLKVINNRNYENYHISFLLTAPHGISYSNKITTPNTNVLNNYFVESLKIQLQYKQHSYSLGDHVVRWLLNTDDPNPFNYNKKKKCVIL